MWNIHLLQTKQKQTSKQFCKNIHTHIKNKAKCSSMLSIIGRWPHSTENFFHALILSQISINVNCVKQTRLFQLQFYNGWIKALFFVGALECVGVWVCATVCMYVSLWIFTPPFDILFFLCHLTIEKCSFLPLMTQRHIKWELIAVLLVFIEPFHNIFTYFT